MGVQDLNQRPMTLAAKSLPWQTHCRFHCNLFLYRLVKYLAYDWRMAKSLSRAPRVSSHGMNAHAVPRTMTAEIRVNAPTYSTFCEASAFGSQDPHLRDTPTQALLPPADSSSAGDTPGRTSIVVRNLKKVTDGSIGSRNVFKEGREVAISESQRRPE